MSSSVELVCVDHKIINEFWPHASGLIRAAIERTGLSDFADIEREVLSGQQVLWLAYSDRIEAAATTQIRNGVCTIVACSGHHRERWISLRHRIEEYAKAQGCSRIRLYGRKGWQRALPDYHVEHVVMEKTI